MMVEERLAVQGQRRRVRREEKLGVERRNGGCRKGKEKERKERIRGAEEEEEEGKEGTPASGFLAEWQ